MQYDWATAIRRVVLHNTKRLTKRAPDAGDSAQIPSSFTRLIIFPVGRLRRPCPSAGNANRWAFAPESMGLLSNPILVR